MGQSSGRRGFPSRPFQAKPMYGQGGGPVGTTQGGTPVYGRQPPRDPGKLPPGPGMGMGGMGMGGGEGITGTVGGMFRGMGGDRQNFAGGSPGFNFGGGGGMGGSFGRAMNGLLPQQGGNPAQGLGGYGAPAGGGLQGGSNLPPGAIPSPIGGYIQNGQYFPSGNQAPPQQGIEPTAPGDMGPNRFDGMSGSDIFARLFGQRP